MDRSVVDHYIVGMPVDELGFDRFPVQIVGTLLMIVVSSSFGLDTVEQDNYLAECKQQAGFQIQAYTWLADFEQIPVDNFDLVDSSSDFDPVPVGHPDTVDRIAVSVVDSALAVIVGILVGVDLTGSD